MSSSEIPPVKRSVSVSWDQKTAFERFTTHFASWWPASTHSIGGDRVKRVVFETNEGGRIYEEHEDGRRFQWGQILVWDPPGFVKFTWHPSKDPSVAQEVELRFTPEGKGTRLELISTGWEKLGRRARRAQKGYNIGWGYVLNVWAGRRTTQMAVMDGIVGGLNLLQRFRGGRAAEIRRAEGEMRST
jgi:uncharacterized protein YndB with AHSA1/START domain